jgi:hypothetical protein
MKRICQAFVVQQIGLIALTLLFLNFKSYSQGSYFAPDKALENARTLLHNKQKININIARQSLNGEPVTETALRCLEEMVEFSPTDDPSRVRRDGFSYHRELEERRIAKAKAIIQRIEPGPFESPIYLSMLAYQAASIEMAFGMLNIDTTQFSKFLLGTINAPDIDAFAHKESIDDYTIVVIYSGLVDFMYQASKVVVEALKPSRSTMGNDSAVLDLKAIKDRLNSDPAPADRLYKTLEACFFSGYPRASVFESVPQEYIPALTSLVGSAERFVIAHEYGHGLMPWSIQFPDSVNPINAKEYFPDDMAIFATVFSEEALDGMPPDFSLGGAIFAVACLDIFQKAHNILITGDENSSGTEELMGFKPQERAKNIINCFMHYFDVEYLSNREVDLSFNLKHEIPPNHGFTIEHIQNTYAYWDVLQTVWEPVKLHLLEDFHQKRSIHPSWNK